MFSLQHTPGRTAVADGKEYLFFSGYSYLDMQHVPEFIVLIKEGIDKYGLLFPSSRISNTQLQLFSDLESKLSAITGMENSLCFSSGFMAGRAVITMLQERYQYLFSAPGTHPAICYPGTTTLKDHNAWCDEIVDRINSIDIPGPVVITLDAVNPLSGQINDLSFLHRISKQVICVADDSHGIGITGDDGSGVSGYFPKQENIELIITYSLSKAFNIHGGAVSCSKKISGDLATSQYFAAGTSISPGLVYAFLQGQHLYQIQREKLKRNIAVFNEFTGHRFCANPSLPIFALPADTSPEKLAEHHIIISSFAYPDPSGQRINRIVLNASHTDEDLEYLAKALLGCDTV